MAKKRATRKESMGKTGLFLLPSLKMRRKSARGKSYDEELHDFLVKHFSGYTVSSGSISGYWKDEDGREHYGEHREYKVAFLKQKKVPLLEEYIAKLAEDIEEECVFWEKGDEAWLIYRTGMRRRK
ncbi:MAG: hypothetical protein JWM04_1427 [Verrucomicrobiales bacterium]|nr:hypothetical protein [Verrucomicrobiales bacterium]